MGLPFHIHTVGVSYMGRTIRIIRPYVFAILTIFLAFEIKWFIQPYLSTSPPFITFIAAIMFIAWQWGFVPALFATALSALIIDFAFIPPFNALSLSPGDVGSIAFFCLLGATMAYAIHHLQGVRHQAETLQRQLHHLHELSTRLLEEKDFEGMLNSVLTVALELLNADKGVLQLYDPHDNALRMTAHVGFNEEFFSRFKSVPVDFFSCGAAFQRQQRVIVENVATDPTFSQLAPLFSSYQVVSAQSTPLFNADRQVFGVLSTYSSRAWVPSQEEFRLLDLYARHAERILEAKHAENTLRRDKETLERRIVSDQQQISETEQRLREVMSDLAVTEERERRQLASELHDYLAQILTLGQMKLKLAQQSLGRSPRKSERFMEEAAEALKCSLEYARTLMAELCPPDLHEAGLLAAVRWLAGQMSKHGLTVEVHSNTDRVALPDDQAVLLYKSIRELLLNVVKHAQVNRAMVSFLVDSDQRLRVTVRDEGRGYDVPSAPPDGNGSHFGLSSIRERMAAMGGWLEEESAVGRGTTMTLGLLLEPLPDAVQAASSPLRDRVKTEAIVPSNQQRLPYESL